MINKLSRIFERRELLKQMVISNLKAGQSDLFLGYAWWVLEPILLMLIYWYLVGVIFGRGGPDYPLFVLCGLIPFRAFVISFNQSVLSISGKFGLIGQINFPRIFLPLSHVIVNHIKLIFGFIIVVLITYFYKIKIDFSLFLIVIPMSIQIIFVSGLALITSVLGVYFRDLKNIVQLLTRILLYFSPVLYSLNLVPEQFKYLYLMNPIAALLVTYRAIIMKNNPLDYNIIMLSTFQALIVLLIGYFIFIRHENKLLKLI